MSPDPDAPPSPPPVAGAAATEPRRSSRKRFKSAAAIETEAEAEADIDRKILRGETRARQRRAGTEKPGPGASAIVAAEMEGAEAELDAADHGASRAQPRGKRRRSRAAKAKPRTRRRADKEKTKESAEAEEPAAADDDVCAEEPDSEEIAMEEEEAVAALEAEEEEEAGGEGSAEKVGARKRVARPSTERRVDGSVDNFVGEPMPDHEARQKWPERYMTKGSDSPSRRSGEDEELKARCHYRSANVDNVIYQLDDDVYVKAGPNEENYIGRITEFFKGLDQGSYFTCQWFFRTADTAISSKLLKVHDHKHDHKRVFLSEERNDNMIACIVSKIKIIHVDPNTAPQAKVQFTKDCDFYYDMSYSVAYSTFANLPADNDGVSSSAASNISDDAVDSSKETLVSCFQASSDAHAETISLLDLYSGCGAMSTGLCLGAALSNFKLETRWAVDMNAYACESLKYNHPRSKVRNEKAGDFLALLKEWDALCKKYIVQKDTTIESEVAQSLTDDEDEPVSEEIFEVEKLLDICYGDPNSTGQVGLWFKVRWKGYDPSYDTWEPMDGLRDCPQCIKDFVESGYRENILPLPVLPKFPLPTHDVVKRGVVPNAFEQSVVAYDEIEAPRLRKALFLADAISDLPEVGNNQPKDVMDFIVGPKTEFQRYIRLNRKAMMDYSFDGEASSGESKLFDHQPLRLNDDDYERGANFRDLKGVKVPDYAMSFIKGKSLKPFGRLWWDETVPTVVTRAEPHNQIILHPSQARVLTIRENARLQGFPDYYKLFGPIKQKYMQVGNAVAVPVARALGYSLGMAYMGRLDGDGPLFKLPKSFTRTGVFSGGEDVDVEEVLD
ncbi:DNA (cytosine-5)-methyltransferase CMT1-like [Setaria italica]|uniref:DNA (cytosine-5)-methyltransferase CMT1-like n=1 Tax=Setaria italica TaxID=4555 RepID=UPI0007199DAF|nr:DNA (cytosine-5)-methyltransferase CMT1-like [Setaria italica]